MSSLRNFLARRLIRPLPSSTRNPPSQRRWARVHDVRFSANHGVQNHVIDRYKEKLDRKARDAGHGTISELQEAYREDIERLRKQAIVPGATGPLELQPSTTVSPPLPSPPPVPQQQQQHQEQEKQDVSSSTPVDSAHPTPPPPLPTPPQSATQKAIPGLKTLSSFLDVPKLGPLPPADIEALWRLRFASTPNTLHFTLPATSFAQLTLTARRHPQFVLPLPREGSGAEMHFLQFAWPHDRLLTILFTHLAEYKVRGEYATAHTSVSLHSELAVEKGIVLGQGTVMEGRGVGLEDARFLLMCMQKFYGVQQSEGSGERRRLLDMFSRGDEAFDVQKLLEEAERLV